LIGANTGAAARIAVRFALQGDVSAIEVLTGGHINESYRVTVSLPESPVYLLQRVNARVFPRPDQVMENVARVTTHLRARLQAEHLADWQRRTLQLVPTTSGAPWLADRPDDTWRMFVFIAGTVAREHASGPDDARAAGQAYGAFLRRLADYSGPVLHETIPGFHDTSGRLARLRTAVRAASAERAARTRADVAAVLAGSELAAEHDRLLQGGALPRRIVHNDAKLANVLFDTASGAPLCVVDLDTVMPGTSIYDFGDMIRSITSPTAEDERDLTRIDVRLPLFEALAAGYLESAGSVLTAAEIGHLVFGGLLITLEQAARFLTDYLEGDRYYAIQRPDHNLERCRAQLRLLDALTAHRSELEATIRRLSG
jgi:aminoglycoside phosphotransferase (APT) family kinase protein